LDPAWQLTTFGFLRGGEQMDVKNVGKFGLAFLLIGAGAYVAFLGWKKVS
jgi:hypothetical protein